MTAQVQSWLRWNWFVVLAPILLLIEWLVVRSSAGAMGSMVEAIVLFDLCLFIPLLYVLCYRSQLPLKPLLLRVLGLVCLGVYIASYIVPEPAQQIVPQLSWARTAGLAVLALVELALLLTVLRLVWGRDASAEQVQAASGAPAWVARLMVVEARFWRAVWRLIRRR
jgi:hypothetical protein